MLVASGRLVFLATSAMLAVPLVGSSRYSRTPSSAPATSSLGGTDQAALELARGEAVVVGHPLCLGGHPGRVARGAPVVAGLAGPGVLRPAVEQVGAVVHRVADLAAEQRVHRHPELVAQRVQDGHL